MDTLEIKTLCEKCGGVVAGVTFDSETAERPCRCEKQHAEDLKYKSIPKKKDDNE